MQTTVFAVKQIVAIKPLAEVVATAVLVGIIIVGMTLFVARGTLEVAALLTFFVCAFSAGASH